MKVLKFKCPKCGKKVLEEVMVEVTQSSSISAIEDDNGVVFLDYENTSTDGGEVDRYQCMECGYILKNKKYHCDISTPEELAEWLKDNCKQ
jgi:predicted RNA-binding Zn-ribbon protein involved in translation (DUF1610 family)